MKSVNNDIYGIFHYLHLKLPESFLKLHRKVVANHVKKTGAAYSPIVSRQK